MTVASTDGHLGLHGGAQQHNIISGSGLFALIFESYRLEANTSNFESSKLGRIAALAIEAGPEVCAIDEYRALNPNNSTMALVRLDARGNDPKFN
ncbi:MAG: hypothetical protein LUF68_00915 [Clostridiales bacterium]|nr:hypothetical protein [Clostridiales bacterium]